jgi:hypothetical protein
MRWFYEIGDRWRLWDISMRLLSIYNILLAARDQSIAGIPAVLVRSPRGNLEYLRLPWVTLRIVHFTVCICPFFDTSSLEINSQFTIQNLTITHVFNWIKNWHIERKQDNFYVPSHLVNQLFYIMFSILLKIKDLNLTHIIIVFVIKLRKVTDSIQFSSCFCYTVHVTPDELCKITCCNGWK